MAAYSYFLATVVFTATVWVLQLESGDAFGTFGFDVHHRYSDPVKGILGLQGLPEKGSADYYSSWVARDKHRLSNGRRLAGSGDSPLLTFQAGNETVRLNSLQFLYYANVSVGTPPQSFMVALDTGSELFWLPCNCTNCTAGRKDMYRPDASSTSQILPCNATQCRHSSITQCLAQQNLCAYSAGYVSNSTTTGLFVDDILHLLTDDTQQKSIQAPITLGCGLKQTGDLVGASAPKGLFGLGVENISVPSTLASKGVAAKSFSMCFAEDGNGRIVFGDKGSSNQQQTPFIPIPSDPSYYIRVTQIAVGKTVSDVNLTAVFDSGTSFTFLNDPTYSIITKNFNSLAKEPHIHASNFPFEYCYELSGDQTSAEVPHMNLTMKGGHQFHVVNPIVVLSVENVPFGYCLAVIKSTGDKNLIGQNFMTGYRVVFNSEDMVLGWEDCYKDEN